MPTYEYRCPKCGDFELSQRISESALKRCPTCKGKVSKLISSTSFQLKGTGWYATDYASKGKGGDSKDSPSSSDSGKDDKASTTAKETTAKETTAKETTAKDAKASAA